MPQYWQDARNTSGLATKSALTSKKSQNLECAITNNSIHIHFLKTQFFAALDHFVIPIYLCITIGYE